MQRRQFLATLPLAGSSCLAQLQPDVKAYTRLRTALCAYSFRDALKNRTMSYADVIRLAVALGLDGVDLTVYWLPADPSEMLPLLRGIAYRHAVDIYSISIGTDMCRPTPEARAAEVDFVKRWVDVAEKLGAGHVRVFGGNVPKEATEEQAVPWVIEILKQASEYSGSKGIVLGLENHGGITSTAATIIEIVRAVNSPWVGINLDTGNFRTDALAQIESCARYAVNVQLKSEIAGPDGTKMASDWDRIGRILSAAGYKGYIALEYEAKEDPATAVPRLARRLRQVAERYSSKPAS
jgi:L-ribulose-5-phosphate 3-epimerase